MDFITDLQQRLSEQSAEMLMSYTGDVSVKSLSEMETSVKQMLHELGNDILVQWLEAQDQKYPDDERVIVPLLKTLERMFERDEILDEKDLL